MRLERDEGNKPLVYARKCCQIRFSVLLSCDLTRIQWARVSPFSRDTRYKYLEPVWVIAMLGVRSTNFKGL